MQNLKASLFLLFIFLISFLGISQLSYTLSPSGLPLIVSAVLKPIDLDGDKDLDLIVIGKNGDTSPYGKLLVNDGYGYFTENQEIKFTASDYAQIVVLDLNNDNRQDFMIFGINQDQSVSNIVYINDGMGNFDSANLPGVMDINAWTAIPGDLNMDGYTDILISGINRATNKYQTIFLINNGNGTFTNNTNNIFKYNWLYTPILADIDSDSDLDIITFSAYYSLDSSVVFLNNGQGAFTPHKHSGINYQYQSRLTSGDFNNDGKTDIISIAKVAKSVHLNIFINQDSGNFSTKSPFYGYTGNYNNLFTDDVDNDGNLDLILFDRGYQSTYETITYKGLGNGTLDYTPHKIFNNLDGNPILFDCDQDGDQDFAMIGVENLKYKTKLFKNDIILNSTELAFKKPVLYPNPSTGNIKIETYNNQPVQVSILNISGQIVYQNQFSNSHLIELKLAITSGIYFVEIIHSTGSEVSKLIIKR